MTRTEFKKKKIQQKIGISKPTEFVYVKHDNKYFDNYCHVSNPLRIQIIICCVI